MSTIFIISQIRQKAEGFSFSSSRFALRFHQHQNLRYAYPFSHSAGKGISALVFTFIHSLEHLISMTPEKIVVSWNRLTVNITVD